MLTERNGRLELESKVAMRARGLRSPDRADAVLGALADNRAAPATMPRAFVTGQRTGAFIYRRDRSVTL
jgi:hypothetical protein